MDLYLTEKRFRNMGLGVSLTRYTDQQLRQIILTSQALVDTYCNVPRTPKPYSFAGGSITAEQRTLPDIHSRRIYPFHKPVREVTEWRILATESLFISFAAGDFFIHTTENFVEIINFALTQVGIWGQADVPQMGLIRPVSEMDYAYGYQFPIVDESMSDLPSGEFGAEQDFMAFNGSWDESADVEVKSDGVVVDPSEYEVDYAGGFVTFNAPRPGESISASYTFKVPWEVQRATALASVEEVGQSRIAERGMTGIDEIQVEEIRVRRYGARTTRKDSDSGLPVRAEALLGGYRFWTIR